MGEMSVTIPNTKLVQYLSKQNNQKISAYAVKKFQQEIMNFYAENKRDLPWRAIDDPYRILVSEIMLQQTQVDRVLEKYLAFIEKFPTVHDLAAAELSDVLYMWQGLGYNRRGMYLHQLAGRVVHEWNGAFPIDPVQLQTLPGIGSYTAKAVSAFAYQTPVVLIETNVRTIFLYYFFHDQIDVHDKEIFPLIEKTLLKNNSRDWYYALMDYGSILKKKVGNSNKKSKHYTKQSKFQGSDRQVRGMILKFLLGKQGEYFSTDVLAKKLQKEQERVENIIWHMVQEGLIKEAGNKFFV